MNRTTNKRTKSGSPADKKATKKAKIEESLEISESSSDRNIKPEGPFEAVESNAGKQVKTRGRLRKNQEQVLSKPDREKDLLKDLESQMEDQTQDNQSSEKETDDQIKPQKKSKSEKKDVKKPKKSGEVKESKKKRTPKSTQSIESKPMEEAVVREPENSKKYIGGHCSIAGGLYKAVEEAYSMGAYAFGLFLRSTKQWAAKPLGPQDVQRFKQALQSHGFPASRVVVHGCYLMNCGSENADIACKSRTCLLDEVKRCEELGLLLCNFHPGSTCGKGTQEDCLRRIADSINYVHDQTASVIIVLETMCRQGHTVGGTFEELRDIIRDVRDKTRVGVCLDTCHVFAAGFDLNSEVEYEKMMRDFDSIIGLDYLKALHINDSKGPCGCRVDRHENIAQGHITKTAFQRLMQDARLDHLPMVLETPGGQYDKEINLLYGLEKQK